MKKQKNIYATIFDNTQEIKTYKISKDLLNELLQDKNYYYKSKEILINYVIYELIHINNNKKSLIVIKETI